MTFIAYIYIYIHGIVARESIQRSAHPLGNTSERRYKDKEDNDEEDKEINIIYIYSLCILHKKDIAY